METIIKLSHLLRRILTILICFSVTIAILIVLMLGNYENFNIVQITPIIITILTFTGLQLSLKYFIQSCISKTVIEKISQVLNANNIEQNIIACDCFEKKKFLIVQIKLSSYINSDVYAKCYDEVQDSLKDIKKAIRKDVVLKIE